MGPTQFYPIEFSGTIHVIFVERSLVNLDVESLDLVQLHCPPTEVYYNPEVFEVLDDLTKAGKIKHYGVSVEKVEETIKAIEFSNVKRVQIVFNIFRTCPAELFFLLAQEQQVAILVRGLVTGQVETHSPCAPKLRTGCNYA